MTDPGSLAVNQADYIEALEDDLRRESQARRVLQALVNQRTRTLQSYIERYGDITEQPAESKGGPDAGSAPVG